MTHSIFKLFSLSRSKSSLFKREKGTTFIECLIVVAIIGGLIAAVSSSFLLTIKSYTGEYDAEGAELEMQRACTEINYYVTRATRVAIYSDLGLPSSQGNFLYLPQPNSEPTVYFLFSPTNTSTSTNINTNTIPSLITGTLSATIDNGTNAAMYTYGGSINPVSVGVVSTNFISSPFWFSSDGGVGYSFRINSADGVTRMGGISRPSL